MHWWEVQRSCERLYDHELDEEGVEGIELQLLELSAQEAPLDLVHWHDIQTIFRKGLTLTTLTF